jgi:hypothetical protein
VQRRRAPLLGSTPPHQPTLFGPGYRIYLKKHSQDQDIRLAKDLARNL